ncbi:MAG: hypothetical protein K1X89_20145 [Myxococcaceae bacterium]|nr:hypothetical protein [Myxococcaceae bacterium]
MVTLLLAASLAAAPAPGSRQKVVSVPWHLVNVSPELGTFFADRVASGMRSDSVEVTTSSEIAAVLGQERQLQLLGCSEAASGCLAELGSALGADVLLTGSLAKLDDLYQGNLKLLGASDGRVIAEVGVSETGQRALSAALDRAAAQLSRALAPAGAAPVATSSSAFFSRSKAWVPLAAGGAVAVVGALFLGLAGSRYGTLKGQLDGTMPIDAATFRSDAGTGSTFQTVGWVALGVGLAGLALGGVMALFGEAPAGLAALVTPQGLQLGLTVRLP